MQSLILTSTRLALRRSKAMLPRRSNIVNYTAHSYRAFQCSAFSSGKDNTIRQMFFFFNVVKRMNFRAIEGRRDS